MKVFIAGATGVLGRRLIRQLGAKGHEVLGLARSSKNEETIRSLGGTPRSADLFDADSLARAAEGCEAVVHAATAIPAAMAKPSDWEMNDRIRREGTTALTEAAGRIRARIYLQQSIVWVARPEDGKAFNESSRTIGQGAFRSAADAEVIARVAGAKHGFAVSILRGSFFYCHDSAHTIDMASRLRKGQLPVIGSGKNLFSLIHVDDMASSFVEALESGKAGLWHVTDDLPVSQKDFLTHFAAELGARAPQSVPEMMAKMFAGADAVAFMTANTETNNHKLKEELGWKPQFPTYVEGLKQVLEEWCGKASR